MSILKGKGIIVLKNELIMCWISRNTPIKRKANQDITVYKILRISGDKSIHSPIYHTVWYIGQCKEDHNLYVYFEGSYYISSGFHSLRRKPLIVEMRSFCTYYEWVDGETKISIFSKGYNDYVFKCVIPKGSTYYENENGEIVSNKLIIVKQCNV